MNHTKRIVFIASLGLLLSGPCWALGEADSHWNLGVVQGKEVAAIAAAWRPQGIGPMAIPVNPLDLDGLKRKLGELKKNIDMATHPAPGIGIFFFDEQNPLLVTHVLINGPADRAGVRLGDEVVQVNGRSVSNNMDVIAAMQGTSVEMKLKRGDVVPIEKQVPQYFSPEFIGHLEEEVKRIQTMLESLERQAQNPRADVETLAVEGSELNSGLDRLKIELSAAQNRSMDLYRKLS